MICNIRNTTDVLYKDINNITKGKLTNNDLVSDLSSLIDINVDNEHFKGITTLKNVISEDIDVFKKDYIDIIQDKINRFRKDRPNVDTVHIVLDGMDIYIPSNFYQYMPLKSSDIPGIAKNISQLKEIHDGADKLLTDVVNNNIQNKINFTVGELASPIHTPIETEISADDNSEVESPVEDDSKGVEYLKDLTKKAQSNKRRGVLDNANFSILYFKDNTEMHINRFNPYITSIFNTSIFRLDDENMRDAVADADNAIISVLLTIKNNYNLQASEKNIIPILRKDIIKGLEPIVQHLFSIKELSEFDSKERNLYFDYLLAKELQTIISNNVNYISEDVSETKQLSKDGTDILTKKTVSYSFNSEIENGRTNYDSAKNGDKNSKFIKGVINSFNKIIPINENFITEDSLLNIIQWSKEDLESHRQDKETPYDTIKRVLEVDYVIDPNDRFISYNQYKAIFTDKHFIAIRNKRDNIISYLSNLSTVEGQSIYHALYSEKTTYFDPELTHRNNGKVSFNSLDGISKNNIIHTDYNENNQVIFQGNFDTSNTRKILEAIELNMKSMDKRLFIDVNGVINTVGNTDIISTTNYNLMQQLEDEHSDGTVDLSSRLKGLVTLSKGLPKNNELLISKDIDKTESQRRFEDNIFVNINVGENKIVSIPLITNFNNKGIFKEQPNPNESNSIVAVARNIQTPDEIFQGIENDNPVLKTSEGKAVLKALGFPEPMLKTVVKALLSRAKLKRGNVINVHDFTNFVANYATLIALNDNSININNKILDELGILDKESNKPNSIIKLDDNYKPISKLRYDIYSYLKPYTLSLYAEEEVRRGVSIASISVSPGVKMTAVSPSGNMNLESIKQDYKDGRFKNNDFIKGDVKIEEVAIKKGVYNPSKNIVEGQKNLTLGQKRKQLVEANFIGAINNSINSKRQVANIQLTANESTLVLNYNISKGVDYDFIPLNINENTGDFSLNTNKLDNELITKQRNYYYGIIDSVSEQYTKAFSAFEDVDNINDIEISEVLDKFEIINPLVSRFEAFNILRDFNNDISSLNKDSYYMHNLRDILDKYNFDLGFFDLIPGISQGIFYNTKKVKGRKKASINLQLLYDIDIWFNQMQDSDTKYSMGYKDYYTPTDYIKYVMTSYINKVNSQDDKTNFSVKAFDNFKNISGLKINSTKKEKLKVKNIIYKAYHYQEMMLNVDLGPILFNDVYLFMKNPIDIKSINQEDNSRNHFFINKLTTDAEAYQSLYKRAKPLTQTGGDSNNIPTKLNVMVFYDPEKTVNSLGSLKESSTEVYDGLYFRFPFASYMHEHYSSGKEYGYNPLANVVKDIVITRDPVTGNVNMDKRAAHNLFDKSVLEFNKENYEKDYNDKLTFRKDGKPVTVLVPAVVKTIDTIIVDGVETSKMVAYADYTQAPTTIEAKTINDIFRYLGGNLNPDLYKNASDIITLSENNISEDEDNNINGKYVDGLSFISSRKMGADIINPVSSFNNKSSKIYPVSVDPSGMKIILDGTENPLEKHSIAIASQMLSASFAGTESDFEGNEIYNALSSLFETSLIQMDQDVLVKLYDMIANGDTSMIPLSKNIGISNNVFDKLNKLSKDEAYKDAVKKLWHAYVIEVMDKDIIKKSQDTALKDMLSIGGDINGQLNPLFISIINTHISSSLNTTMDGMNNLATQANGMIKLYGKDGVSKSRFMNNSISINEDETIDEFKNRVSEFKKRRLNSIQEKELSNSEIIYTNSLDNLIELGIDKENVIILETFDDVKNHKELNKSSNEGITQAIVLDVDLAVYADFAISNNDENISIIKDNRASNYLKEITILDVKKDSDIKVNKLMSFLVHNNDISVVC